MKHLIGVPGSSTVSKQCVTQCPNPPIPKCNPQVLLKENYLSEFITQEEKRKVLQNLGLIDDTISWGQIGGFLEQQTDLWQKLTEMVNDINSKISKELEGSTATTQIAYTNDAYPNMKNLQEALDQLLYKDLTIQLSCSPNVKEVGETVESITYKWSYNKPNIQSQTFDGSVIDVNIRTITLDGQFTETTTKILTANDGTKEIQASCTLNFFPGIYYGSSTVQDFQIRNLSRLLQSSRRSTITVDCTDDSNVYIYICIPYDYGVPTFTVNGFEGGFELIDDNYQFDKYNTGKPIRYYIYKSDNGGLGVTTINIS